MPVPSRMSVRSGALRAVLAWSVVGATLTFVSAPAQAAPAPTATTHAATQAAPGQARAGERPLRYLSLGDSLAAGYRPASPGRSAGDDRSGGYVGVVAAGLRAAGRPVRVTNLACTGETTATLLAGGRCDYRHGSQLAAARAHLRAHPDTALVTVTIGANDVRRCLDADAASAGRRDPLDSRCATDAIDAAGQRVAALLSMIRQEAPAARIVVLDYYNPYLALRLAGPQGERLARASVLVHARLNSELRHRAFDAGARTAYVSEAFGTQDLTLVDLPGAGRVPRNVARICDWTWMCTAGDIHADAAGYDIMGRAVLTRLSQRR